jgi:uncharacterized membrane protein YkvA (DUF1232 family)
MATKPNQDYFDKGSSKMDEADVKKAAESAEKLKDKLKDSKSLSKFFDELMLLTSLIKDYWKGHYRKIPYKAIAAIAFTILYVLNMVDLIPDFIPGLGLLDDATVVGLCLKLVSSDMAKYKDWKFTEASLEKK